MCRPIGRIGHLEQDVAKDLLLYRESPLVRFDVLPVRLIVGDVAAQERARSKRGSERLRDRRREPVLQAERNQVRVAAWRVVLGRGVRESIGRAKVVAMEVR